MQLVEVQEVPVLVAKPIEVSARAAKPKLFNNLRKVELMAFGVPEEWVDDVRAANEDTLSHLPQEAQEALLKLAVGEKPDRCPSLSPILAKWSVDKLTAGL